MPDDEDLFLRIIAGLDDGGVLQQVVLIGSWALRVYQTHFDNDPEVPILTTTDVDFLVPNPPRLGTRFDVGRMLADLGFDTEWASVGGYCKYESPDMEVEFLAPSRQPDRSKPVPVEELGTVAQPLEYVSLAYDRSMIVRHRGHDVRVPQPEAFVVLKLLVIPKRKDNEKRAKDILTVRELGGFLARQPDANARFRAIVSSIPKKWQRTALSVADEHCQELTHLLRL